MKIYRTQSPVTPVWNGFRSPTLTLCQRITWRLDHQWLQLLNMLLSSEHHVNVSQPQAPMRALLFHSLSLSTRHDQRDKVVLFATKLSGLERDPLANSNYIFLCPLRLGAWSLIGWTQKTQTMAKNYWSWKPFQPFYCTSKVLIAPIICVQDASGMIASLLSIWMNLYKTQGLRLQLLVKRPWVYNAAGWRPETFVGVREVNWLRLCIKIYNWNLTDIADLTLGFIFLC